jgi:hypothetical protein
MTYKIQNKMYVYIYDIYVYIYYIYYVYIYIYILAGVPGVAREDKVQNQMDGVVFGKKEKGQWNRWKCVTLK